MDKFRVHTNEILGRHLKATRDIKPGEVILQESPLIWGPAQVTVPVCLGCGKGLTKKHSRPCSKCGWPMCSEICEKAPGHIPECRYTVLRGDKVSIKNFGMVHPTYQCITVLRVLYQKQFLPEVWKKIDMLQSHCEERKGTQKYEQDRISVAKFILRFFKLDNVFTEEDILRVCGIVMVNSHEVPLTEPPHIAIYENTSMFEHNCSANCAKSFTSKGGVLISAGSLIKKGDNLSICYTDPLWGTPNRRQHLHETKFFWCECHRCSDPTEFDTYFSALKCQDRYVIPESLTEIHPEIFRILYELKSLPIDDFDSFQLVRLVKTMITMICLDWSASSKIQAHGDNCQGYLLPKTFIENSNNEKGADWHCNECKSSLSSYSVCDLLERIGRDLNEMPKGVSRECRNFIETYEQLLHRNHFYLTDVKLALSDLIGQENEVGLAMVSYAELGEKIRLCQSLANLMYNLIPGEKRVRGLLLFELHASLAEMGRRNQDDPDVLHTALLDSKKILLEALELLKHEPEELAEGKIYKQAVANLKEFQVFL